MLSSDAGRLHKRSVDVRGLRVSNSRSRDASVDLFFLDNRGADCRESILSSGATCSLPKDLHKALHDNYYSLISGSFSPYGCGNDVYNEIPFSIWSSFLLHSQFY